MDLMDLKKGHLLKAESSNKFLYTIDLNRGYFDWAIIVAFYTALHYVSAYLTTKDKFKVENHPQMLKLIAIYLPKIAKDYSDLFQAGWLARYNVYYKPSLSTFLGYRDSNLFNIKSHITELLK